MFYLLDSDGEAEDDDEEEEEESVVWVTMSQLRGLRKVEEGRHVYPIVRKAHRLLEEAIRNGQYIHPLLAL